MLLGFRCTKCGKLVEVPLETGGRCPSCQGTLLAVYGFSDVDAEMLDGGEPYEGIWRFRRLLPPTSSEVSLGEGGTPLLGAARLSEELKLKKVLLKNEGENPTGSFMDRGSAVLVSKLLDHGVRGVCGVFKGNLGASLAAYTARAGLECLALLREPIDAAKLYQMIAYGAKVKAWQPGLECSGLYCVRSADPYMVEGFKTVCFEICSALSWRCPEVLVVPVGSGGLITAVWKGLKELEALGLIQKASARLIGVQPSFCAPVVEKWRGVKLSKGEGLVVDLAFPEPERGAEALAAIRESKGAAVAVSEVEMIEASRRLAKLEGIFAELAAASTVAALAKSVEDGLVDRGEEVVCLVTGSGLKDPTAVLREAERSLALERLIKGLRTPGARRVLGATKLEILKILGEKETHGYRVWKLLLERGYSVAMPVVYQHLRELKSMGLILVKEVQVVKNRKREIYALSKKGRAVLEALS